VGPDDLRALHNRIPLVLEEADWPVWLGEIEGGPTALLRPAAEDALHVWPISRGEQPAQQWPDLLAPLFDADGMT
jgi:putative SOS response-associated peptidase YedK